MTRNLTHWLLLPVLLCVTAPVFSQEVRLVELSGAIGPATSDFVMRSLEDAAETGTELVILRIDTPGGLDLAMRDIIQNILASEVPVAGWVAPNGARAASAGTYIMYASHFAAMAPATNIGSSTPVSIGGGSSPLPVPSTPDDSAEPEDDSDTDQDSQAQPGTAMERKVINDAIAYLRSLAELRGRNAEWAESTVREAANLTATQALDMGVIEIIAANVDDLVNQLEGRTTTIAGQEVTLALDNAEVELIEPDWRHEFLAIITNPNVAYILLMIGVYGILFEFYNPGLGLPGVTGVVCLIVGAFALQMLPINYAGLALIAVGIGLMVTEAVSPSFGVLGIGGVVAFVLGSVMLMDTELEAYQISMPIIAAFAVATAAIFFLTLGALINARKQRVVSGGEAMIGETAEALEDFDGQGAVRIFGEAWTAVSDTPVKKGSKLKVVSRDGLILKVINER
ncbi:MAG: nodulation protein NfeD [Pseudohongiellaceae bacterium]